jgi:25S rRNA (uracil2634-N3)-methyltransferase
VGDFVVDSSICSVNPTGSMATPVGKENQMGVCNEEKWIEHYSSSHKILLVGEGDFSFAVCLGKAFGTAENMIATSFDSKGISWVETFFHLLFLYICFCSPNLVHYFGLVSNWDLFDMYAKEVLTNAYTNALTNLEELKQQRCTVLHHVDVHIMNRHPHLRSKLFDRVIFNFPHAGFIWWECEERQIQ